MRTPGLLYRPGRSEVTPLPKRTKAQRVAQSKAMDARFPVRKADPLNNADKRRKAWATVANGRTFHPHTQATPREFVKG